MELPIITNHKDIHDNFPDSFDRGRKVRVIGKYIQTDVRMRAEPPVYKGNVEIELDDGMSILLYPMWHPKAIDPLRKLLATKTNELCWLVKKAPTAPPPSDDRCSLIGPCMLTIDSIYLIYCVVGFLQD